MKKASPSGYFISLGDLKIVDGEGAERRRFKAPGKTLYVAVFDVERRLVLWSGLAEIRGLKMNLAPLLNAVAPIPLHAFAAMAALVLGIVQLAAPKGALPHRTLGWIWVMLMLTIAVSSFWIHGTSFRLWGSWSPIHLLSIFTPVMLVLGVFYARSHNVRGHKITMISIFTGALVIAGIFTFVPGRIMHKVMFGD
jgi:uncharacterized membrane protein